MVVGAYALTVGGSVSRFVEVEENIGNEEEEEQGETTDLVAWYTKQLSKPRRATWAPEWNDAKGVLERIQWLQIPVSHGELALEKVWQDSVRASSAC